MVDNPFGGETSLSTTTKATNAESKPEAFKALGIGKPELPGINAVPVTVSFEDTAPVSTAQASAAAGTGREVYTIPRRRVYTPVSADFSDPIRMPKQNSKTAQFYKFPARRDISPVSKQYGDSMVRGISFTKSLPSRNIDVETKAPPRDIHYAHPEDFAGGFSFLTDAAIPQTLEELRIEIEKTKKAYEAAHDAMFKLGQESGDSDYVNSARYLALNNEYNRLLTRYNELNRQYDLWEQQEKYDSKTYEDDFLGQWGANNDVGALTETVNAAYYSYLEDPTEENLAYAQELEKLLNEFLTNNAQALDEEGRVLPLLTSDLATYLPQWWNQQKAGVRNGAAGAAVAALATAYTGIGAVPAAKAGFKAGYSAGVGQYSYEQMSGAAYRELISWGVDDETARIAAKDEGVVSGFIEAADALGDLLTFGSGKILKLVNNKTAQKILDNLFKYGINIYTEGVEEGEQRAVSIANRERVLRGEYDKNADWLERKLGLAWDSVKVLWDAYTGQNDEAREEIQTASSAGWRLGLFSSGAGTVSSVLHDSYKQTHADQTASVTTSETGQVQTEQDVQAQNTTSQSPVERGIALAAAQYRKAVEKFSSEPVQDMQPADVQTDLEQNTESQTAGEISAHTSLETLEQSELDWDPYELFSAGEDGVHSATDSVTENSTDIDANELYNFDPWALFYSDENSATNGAESALDARAVSGESEHTNLLEKSFLSGLQSDEESGIMQIESHEETVEPAQTAKAAEQAQKPLTAQERLALLGAALLEKGGMPSPKQLSAMGMDAPTARGIQSLVWLATEGDPAARRAVEAMIDLTAPEAQEEQREADIPTISEEATSFELNSDWGDEIFDELSGSVINDGSHMENGRPKPNVVYQTGEHDYRYETNSQGLIIRVVAKVLKFKEHIERLSYNPNTFGKESLDHAGHLIADWFGGSPELDNLVSQAKHVNRVEFLTLERQWAAALKNNQTVSVHIDLEYAGDEVRPNSFVVKYKIGEERFTKIIRNK